jgi:hypothetical protein
MDDPGDRRLDDAVRSGGSSGRAAAEAWSPGRAFLIALAVGLLAAVAWATLRSVLDITIGSLVVAALGGWGIGASLRRGGLPRWVAAGLAVVAWITALLLAWLVAMAILPGSTRSLAERLEATPFVDWLAPQLGIVEIGALVVWVGATLMATRARSGVVA